ncbi:afadin isoform X5 [Agrilus planipennis]|nr:afadin isoform X5 [Agrilus planipennis]
MRFYFQDSGQKVATKCIRVASDATVEDVIGTLVEKFRPDMRMLSVPSYALYELHEGCPERRMAPDEKPLLVQLNWHVDDREGRFLLKNTDEKTHNSVHDSNASFRRKLSKREKKQLKKQEKLLRMKSENGSAKEKGDGVAEKLYSELPETSFTRSISNPEAVMRRRRQQKLERKLQQFRSKDGGPDTAGGTLKIYGEALCRDVPYKTLLLSIRDTAGSVVREMLDKYGLNKADPSQWCLVQVTSQPGSPDTEYVLDEDECPLSILMNSPNTSSIMFHVRRRPADCAPRKRKKKPGALGATATGSGREPRLEAAPLLVELGPDGSAPSPGDTARSLRLSKDVMEVGSANGIDLQLYGPHIQPRHAVIANTDGLTSITPCHADAHTYVNGQRIHQTTILSHGNLIKFGHSNAYRFLDPSQENRPIRTSGGGADSASVYDRLSGIDRYPRGQDPILPAVLEFPEEPQEQFLARVITHLDVTTPTFRLAPAYTLYLCARYRASTHYRPELTPTERAHKLTLLLQHAAMLIRHTVQDRSTESTSQAFWLANASELLHFLKSDRHVSAFSIQAQDTLADAVQLAFRNLVACLTGELNAVMGNLVSDGSGTGDDHPRDVVNVLGVAMNLLRKCRVNAALTIQLFSQLFHWISARALSAIINNPALCNRSFGVKLFNKLRNLQAWAESQGLELAAECHLAKIVQCAHLLQAPKSTAEELANLSAACFKLNSLQLRALLTQYKAEPGEQVAPPAMLEQAARAAEGVADELARAEGREVRLHEDPAPPLQLLLPDDGFSCDVVQGVPPGLADFLQPLQVSGLCRLATQPTSSGHWTVYMNAPRPPSALSTTQPEIQVIRLHKAGGGMGLSIVAAKGAGQERLGIYIKSVVPGGAADRDGRLAAGDQLLSVDGQSLLGITQEKAAEFLVRTGSVVTLEVAKGGAVYHGLATLLQQPSPTPNRGPRRMSERDLPSRVDSERSIPSSKSVPALHHISPGAEQPSRVGGGAHDVFNPGYSRTSSNNSINTNSAVVGSGGGGGSAPQVISSNPVNNPVNNLRSRSTHNLHQDSGFYQNLSVYRNNIPNPQQLGDRTSALRSSQNSLQSTVQNNPQRPVSAYYPQASVQSPAIRSNLHQSIPNLKSPPTTQRLQNDDSRSGSFPSVNQQYPLTFNHKPPVNSSYGSPNNTSGYGVSPQGQYNRGHGVQNYDQNYNSPYTNQNYGGQTNQHHPGQPPENFTSHPHQNHIYNVQKQSYGHSGYGGQPQNQSYSGPNQNHYPKSHETEVNMKQSYPNNGQYVPNTNNSYPSPTQSVQSYSNGHVHPGGRHPDEPHRYSGGGLLREDVLRHSQFNRTEEMMRYSSSNNIAQAQQYHHRIQPEERIQNEMRTSRSDDLLKQHTINNNTPGGEMMRYASSGNIRSQESSKIELSQLRYNDERKDDLRSNIRGQAKLVEMGEELRRRQNRVLSPSVPTGPQHQHFHPQHQPQNYQMQMDKNVQNLQTMNLNQPLNSYVPQPAYYSGTQTTPTTSKSHPNLVVKNTRKIEDPPELPPPTTHPLYTASMHDPPKMAFYPNCNNVQNKLPVRDPWAREEQEKQAEMRREQARQWQEQQIRELMSLPYRTPQQEEQLRVLQLEREFQRRALEAAEQDDDDTEEKESPTSTPSIQSVQPPASSSINTTVTTHTTPIMSKIEHPPSILKPGVANNHTVEPEVPPPPPERGSSFAVMSMHNKEAIKRVTFDDSSATVTTSPPKTLVIEEPIREDPNSFIRQAESMLASPTTPVDSPHGLAQATPGVIGAQEVYRDPRTRRLAEQQAQCKPETVPEKLSFKEKMKMFAMETGEAGTPKDKSKISRAQREIDNLGSPGSGLVH